MVKTSAASVALYLALGALFAIRAQPQQLWACPVPQAPHGEILHDERLSPGCRPTVTTGDRVEHFVGATLIGIPATLVKAVSGGE